MYDLALRFCIYVPSCFLLLLFCPSPKPQGRRPHMNRHTSRHVRSAAGKPSPHQNHLIIHHRAGARARGSITGTITAPAPAPVHLNRNHPHPHLNRPRPPNQTPHVLPHDQPTSTNVMIPSSPNSLHLLHLPARRSRRLRGRGRHGGRRGLLGAGRLRGRGAAGLCWNGVVMRINMNEQSLSVGVGRIGPPITNTQAKLY